MRAAPVLAVVAVLAIAGGGYLYWKQQQAARPPAGLATANGRIEVERVDIAAKLAGRVAEIRVKEGDFVTKDADRRPARYRRAAGAAGRPRPRCNASPPPSPAPKPTSRSARRSHNLAEIEMRRAAELEQRAAGTRAELERRSAQHLVTDAEIQGARATSAEAKAAKEVAEAQVAQIKATLDDMVLRTPVAGRVEYKLVQTGEVVAAGGRLVTILDLTDVYMTIFLPTSEAGRVALGSRRTHRARRGAELRAFRRPCRSWRRRRSSRPRRSRPRTSAKS